MDLTGITSIQVDPPDGITALPAVPSRDVVQGVLIVGDTAQIGTRRLSVVTPGGRSNELTFEIRPPSPNAPIISNLTLNSTSVSSGSRYFSAYITYSGKFDFRDADGDLTCGSKFLFMVDLGTGWEAETLIVGEPYFNQNGKTSGTINFSFQESFMFEYEDLTGKIPVMCMVQDAAGNLSNILRATVSTWDIPVL